MSTKSNYYGDKLVSEGVIMAGAALPISGDRNIVHAKFPDPPLIETVFFSRNPLFLPAAL